MSDLAVFALRGLPELRAGDDLASPRGRIRNARKMLVAAAVLMSLFLCGSVLVVKLPRGLPAAVAADVEVAAGSV